MEIRPTRVTWPGRPRTGAAVLWVVFVVAAVVSSVLVLRRPPDDRLSDLHIYYGAAEAVRAGDALYGFVAENGGPFTYPPFAAVLFVMLTWVPELTLRIVWLTATAAAVAGLGVTLAHLLGRRAGLWAPGIAITVLVTASAQSNLRFGQVSVFLVLMALADAAGLTPARHRGVLIGLAAAIKLTPLLFVLFFVSSRQIAPAVRASATFLGCALVGAAVLPGDSWTYWSGTFLHTSRIGDLTSTGNQSINGVLLRAGVPEHVLTPVWLALAAAVCLVALWQARRAQLAAEPLRAAVVIGCATVAASPVSWTHHQIWPALAAIILIMGSGRPLSPASGERATPDGPAAPVQHPRSPAAPSDTTLPGELPPRNDTPMPSEIPPRSGTTPSAVGVTAGRAAGIAGVALLATMIVSFGAVAGALHAYPLLQFLGDNARALGAVAVCLAGLGITAAASAPSSPVPETR
ncbi:glycosyltransferase 87 family protein [Catenuloplanes japonicus]|uniref:glycosyltransferase 87 family protein n=1 Tax=Catenuloplanes japonicus TaxID=33876 RepID=UPI00068A8F62|nr:glycosyltransferase 87 family protein [Catenuloplanes japonicus]